MFGCSSVRALVYNTVKSILLENLNTTRKTLTNVHPGPSLCISITIVFNFNIEDIVDVISRHCIARLPNFVKRRLKDGER